MPSCRSRAAIAAVVLVVVVTACSSGGEHGGDAGRELLVSTTTTSSAPVRTARSSTSVPHTAPPRTTTAAPVADPLLPVQDEIAGWSTSEVLAWAGQLPAVVLPPTARWRSLDVGVLYDDDVGALDGVDDVLVLSAPEPVDALVAQLVAQPPVGSSVVETKEGLDADGRRQVTIVVRTPGRSTDEVTVTAGPAGGESVIRLEHRPRADAAGAVLPVERLTALADRLTAGAAPEGWRPRDVRLSVTATGAVGLSTSWHVAADDLAGTLDEARTSFLHLRFEAGAEVDRRRGQVDFTFPDGGVHGTMAARIDQAATTPSMTVAMQVEPRTA